MSRNVIGNVRGNGLLHCVHFADADDDDCLVVLPCGTIEMQHRLPLPFFLPLFFSMLFWWPPGRAIKLQRIHSICLSPSLSLITECVFGRAALGGNRIATNECSGGGSVSVCVVLACTVFSCDASCVVIMGYDVVIMAYDAGPLGLCVNKTAWLDDGRSFNAWMTAALQFAVAMQSGARM